MNPSENGHPRRDKYGRVPSVASVATISAVGTIAIGVVWEMSKYVGGILLYAVLFLLVYSLLRLSPNYQKGRPHDN